LISFKRARRDVGFGVFEPTLQELRNGLLGGLEIGAAAHLGDKARALCLRLAFGAFEGVPLALARAGSGVAKIEDDGPMARRALANVALHCFPLRLR
jgi:hypothetical protein